MIRNDWLQLIYKSGDIASQISQLYDQEPDGIPKKIVGMGEMPYWEIVNLQHKRLKEILAEIQKGYKTSGIED